MFFISTAHAQESDTQPVGNPASSAATTADTGAIPTPPISQQFSSVFLPLVLIFCIFYFLLIRPQHKKIKAHAQMVGGLKKGDKVVTSGGIIGSITKLNGDSKTVDIEIAPDVVVRALKHTVTELAENTPLAKEAPVKKVKTPKTAK